MTRETRPVQSHEMSADDAERGETIKDASTTTPGEQLDTIKLILESFPGAVLVEGPAVESVDRTQA